MLMTASVTSWQGRCVFAGSLCAKVACGGPVRGITALGRDTTAISRLPLPRLVPRHPPNHRCYASNPASRPPGDANPASDTPSSRPPFPPRVTLMAFSGNQRCLSRLAEEAAVERAAKVAREQAAARAAEEAAARAAQEAAARDAEEKRAAAMKAASRAQEDADRAREKAAKEAREAKEAKNRFRRDADELKMAFEKRRDAILEVGIPFPPTLPEAPVCHGLGQGGVLGGRG